MPSGKPFKKTSRKTSKKQSNMTGGYLGLPIYENFDSSSELLDTITSLETQTNAMETRTEESVIADNTNRPVGPNSEDIDMSAIQSGGSTNKCPCGCSN